MPLDVTRLSRRDRVLALVMPALLVAIALLQISRVHRYDQSSWNGIGFGMFATYESNASRFVVAYVDTPDGRVRVDIPGDAHRQITEALVVPTRGNLEPIAENVLDEYRRDGATGATVELWMLDVAKRSRHLVFRPFLHETVRAT